VTIFFLIRHAAQALISTHLVGRSPGAPLDKSGLAQAARLGERMRGERFGSIQASPRERTQQTARAIALARGGSPVETIDALDEVDFGAWSGVEFETLAHDPRWRRWNERRSFARAPGGESMIEVQARVVRHLERATASRPEDALVLVSHAEVIRAALIYCLGLSLDAWRLFEISPASITKLSVNGGGATVLSVNEAAG
jgi:broad specificity phosphatase PhoE